MKDLKEKFKSIGIPYSSYKRGPNGKNIMVLNLNKKEVKLWPGSAEITCNVDKANRQLIINSKELERVINTETRFFKSRSHDVYSEKDISDFNKSSLKEKTIKVRRILPNNWDISQRTKISRPPNADIFITGAELTTSGYVAKIAYKVKSTSISFLIGYDEKLSKYPFISQLKDPVKTVLQAHKSLKPKGLLKGYKRQGEWFFNPVSRELNTLLTTKLRDVYKVHNLESGSSHKALILDFREKLYTIGIVFDDRENRHSPLILEKFYEIIRNNEVITRSNSWD